MWIHLITMKTQLLTLVLETCAVFHYNSRVRCKHIVSAVLTSQINIFSSKCLKRLLSSIRHLIAKVLKISLQTTIWRSRATKLTKKFAVFH